MNWSWVERPEQWRSQEFLSLGQLPDTFFLRMGNIGQFKICWAIF
jgi:hypothetical protein